MADAIDEEDEVFSLSFNDEMEKHGFYESMECMYEFDGTEHEMNETISKLSFLEWNEDFQTFMDSIANGDM